MTHVPTYHDTGLSHWGSCSCGEWRSGLSATKQSIVLAFNQHKENP